ncbi:replicative DNA helicase, partial [Paenibacillus alvei]|nr:replicative DNA helicase [Paenibacillus alvei]
MSIKQLSVESYNKEAMLVGILWNNPDMFDIYNEEKLNKKTFGSVIWAFYMGIARKLYRDNYTVFDDITVQQAVTELKLNEKYEKYGGYAIIEELMEETKESSENFEGYYDEVKKYALLREYYKLFGDKVIEQRDNYDYRKLSRNEISMYWNDKINNIDIQHNETSIVAYNLLANLEDFINKLDISPDLGMPFYK